MTRKDFFSIIVGVSLGVFLASVFPWWQALPLALVCGASIGYVFDQVSA